MGVLQIRGMVGAAVYPIERGWKFVTITSLGVLEWNKNCYSKYNKQAKNLLKSIHGQPEFEYHVTLDPLQLREVYETNRAPFQLAVSAVFRTL